MAWIQIDPECGLIHDEFGGTHIYEDDGLTLAQMSPEAYFQVPWWAALILDFTWWLQGKAAQLCVLVKK